MSGVSAINMVSYYLRSKNSGQEQKLTAITKNRLEAFGIDTKNIKTEQEGRLRLQQLRAEQTSKTNSSSNTSSSGSDELTEKIDALAKKLNISVGKNDTIDDKINKIKKKLEEMMAQAGDDNDKKSKLSTYITDLADIEQMRKGQIDLGVTMDATSNIKRGLLGL